MNEPRQKKPETFDDLVRALLDGALRGGAQRRLRAGHRQRFHRRIEIWAPLWAGDASQNPQDLVDEAFNWFRSEACFDGLSAFAYPSARGVSAEAFLYEWRNSATLAFMRRCGPARLREGLALTLRLRGRMLRGFRRMGTRLGADIYGPESWMTQRHLLEAAPRNLEALRLDLSRKQGAAAISAILEAAHTPLSCAEILRVAANNQGREGYLSVAGELPDDPPSTEFARREPDEFVAEVQKFCRSLSEQEVILLCSRGHAENERTKQNFRELAPDRAHEDSLRLLERRLLESLRTAFPDAEELATAVLALSKWLGGDEARSRTAARGHTLG